MMRPFSKKDLAESPFAQFKQWYEEALELDEIAYANAMCVSTVNEAGYPEGRILLLKSFDDRGFVFFTNTESTKGEALAFQPKAAITFYWDPMGRQIRIQGDVHSVSNEEADDYFRSRNRASQIGAWASDQSRTLESRAALEARVEECTTRFKDEESIPRPNYWGGYRLVPKQIEFWQFGENRLHNRFLYTARKESASWSISRLYP